MIFGRLNTQGSQLSKFLGQKPIWQLCFNWLKNLPKDLPLGRHELDYSIVTAVHSEIKIGDLNHDLFYSNRSLVEIHYIVDGFQKIQLGYAGEELLSEGFNGGEITAESMTASVTMRHSDFLVVFPGEFYQITGPLVEDPLLRKIVISIPIQRFI
jgi:beta-galactosidase beta subunit